jgi:hypothetical protein
MLGSKRFSKVLATALVATLLVLGAIGASHAHHDEPSGGHHCATCRITGSTAIATSAVVSLSPELLSQDRLEIPRVAPPRPAPHSSSAPRGPPLAPR